MPSKRPVGFTLLALFIGCLAFAGIAGAFVIPEPMPLRALSMVYGVTALVAGVAIWRQRTWAAAAFAVWSCVVMVEGVFVVIFIVGSPLKGAAFIVVVAGLLWLTYRYVRKSVVIDA